MSAGDFLKYVGGLTYAESLVACHEVACKALSLAVLQKHDEDEQDCSEYNQNYQSDE